MSEPVEFHTELQAKLIRALRESDGIVLEEYKLPHGKVADIIHLTPSHIITIYEVKTILNASIIQAAQAKYQHYCHMLYIAAPLPAITPFLYKDAINTYQWPTKPPGLINMTSNPPQVMQLCTRHKLPSIIERYIAQHITARHALLTNAPEDPAT